MISQKEVGNGNCTHTPGTHFLWMGRFGSSRVFSAKTKTLILYQTHVRGTRESFKSETARSWVGPRVFGSNWTREDLIYKVQVYLELMADLCIRLVT